MKLRTLRWHWDTMGRQDPMQAILTRSSDDARWNAEDFFASGRAEIDAVMAEAARLAPGLARRRALDFGCGLGRLTSALAGHFETVLGLDIAESMVTAARRLHAQLPGARFEVNLRTDLQPQPDRHFDFVLAWIVLQHMPPALMHGYIAEFVRVLAPGGLLVFQVPAAVEDPQRLFCEAPVVGGGLKQHVPLAIVRASRWARFQLYRRFVPHMEMFAMTRESVVSLVTQCGGRVVEVRPDQSHGPATPGFAYWVTRD